MKWLETLLEPLLDRLALKLAAKVRAQLDGAIDAALDRADDRIDKAFEGLEERLLGVASEAMEDVLKQVTGPIADFKGVVKPVLELQQQIEALGPERVQAAAEAAGMIPKAVAEAQITSAASLAGAAAVDRLRSRLQPPRPWVERPDR